MRQELTSRYSARSALGRLRGAEGAEQGCEQIQREREEGRGVSLRRDLTHGLLALVAALLGGVTPAPAEVSDQERLRRAVDYLLASQLKDINVERSPG